MKFQARNNYLINWPEYPLLRFTICFIIGIYLSDLILVPLWANLLFSFVVTATFLCLNYTVHSTKTAIRILSLFSLIIGVSLGIFRGNLQNESNIAFHFLNYVENENLIVGRVASELKKKKRVSTTLEVLNINGEKSRGEILVYFSQKDSLLSYQKGDIISLDGRVQVLKDNNNPKSFNYKDHLKYKGIGSQIFLKDSKHKLLSKEGVNYVSHLASKIRKMALTIFEERLQNKEQLAIASAMVLGYREHLTDELYTSFSETGAVHVLAVSGLHVGIICMIFIFLFSRIKNESTVFKWLKLLILLSVVWIYTLVTGASPAVLRASVMFSFILIGRLWFKGANIYNILAFSALLILLYDPYLLFQLSFQFSYLALISIVFFQSHIERWYETKHWMSTKIWQLTTVSIAAQILVFPISVFYFHKFPTYFIFSGIAAVFLATFILGIGFLLLGFNQVPILGDIISIVYSKLLEAFIQIISGIQGLPYNNINGVYFSKQSVILLYLLIGAVMLFISSKPKNYKDVLNKKLTRKRGIKIILATCIIFLVSNSILFSFRIKNWNELIVYDISKDTSIDIFCNKKLYTIQSDSIEKKKVEFASKSYRIYNGNPEAVAIDLAKRDDKQNLVLGENGILIFKRKILLFADKVDLNKAIPCTSDILLVVNKTKILPYKFLQYHIPSLVVLDNSLSYKVKNQWIKECKKRNIKTHDVRMDGVFRL